jgi:hypothetical protein
VDAATAQFAPVGVLQLLLMVKFLLLLHHLAPVVTAAVTMRLRKTARRERVARRLKFSS